MEWKRNVNSEFLLADSKENFNNRRIVKYDPDIVLSGAYPRLIDEWQEVFELWDAIQTNVDNDSTKGKFILTGFATIDKKIYPFWLWSYC